MDSPVSALAPFRQPGYSALAASNAISKFGWSVSIVALVWLVRADPGAIGLIFALRAGAGLVFGIPAGLLADRVDRRTLLIATDLAAITIALVTAAAAATGPLPQWGILLVALLFGTVDSFKIASAQAYTYDLVGPLLGVFAHLILRWAPAGSLPRRPGCRACRSDGPARC